ncbi:hypothetical protein N7535_009178 [Penicillium sp. DV-2018c]|nr:hypothetical protein N7461_002921 [Penicillium sp. DV-2018c]KAJ5560981.1 hypothetical protein N7535_009178 [Penicillium sp. DV-2018c]
MSADATWARVAVLAGRAVSKLWAADQPSISCHIGRERWQGQWPTVDIGDWINDNYTIWKLSAALAECSFDEHWTRIFQGYHQATWTQISELVSQTSGAARCLLDIPPPPAEQVTFVVDHQDERHNFVIEETPEITRPSPGFHVLKLLDFVHRAADLTDTVFIAVLRIKPIGRSLGSGHSIIQLRTTRWNTRPNLRVPRRRLGRERESEFPDPPPAYHRLSPAPPVYIERDVSLSPVGRPCHAPVGPRNESPGPSIPRGRSPSPVGSSPRNESPGLSIPRGRSPSRSGGGYRCGRVRDPCASPRRRSPSDTREMFFIVEEILRRTERSPPRRS